MAILLLMVLALAFCSSQGENFFRSDFQMGRHLRWGMTGPPPQVNVTNMVGDSWFAQKLDHYNVQDTRTWQQRYFVNTQYFVQGGPVFLMIGGEGEASSGWMYGGQWITPAKKHGALLFQLEHRYYGSSHPTSDLSTANLQYLTSEQALNDVAYFQQAMQKQYNLQNNKWVVFGCSYSGNLAAWYRSNFPQLAHAAMAGSAPVVAEVDFYQYYQVISSSLEAFVPGCRDQVGQAFQQVQSYMKTASGKQYLSTLFKTCSPLSTLAGYDIQVFYQSLSNIFAGMVQYFDSTTDTYCNDMVRGQGTAIERLAAVMAKVNKGYCLNANYQSMINYYKQNTAWSDQMARQWLYQTCKEFGYYQTTSAKGQSFFGTSVDYYVQQCTDIFGAQFSSAQVYKNIDYTNSIYKGRNLSITRAVFPNGILDPWRALGIQSNVNPDAPAITIDESAHCAIYETEGTTKNPSLVSAQVQIDNLIAKWLNEA